MKKEVTVKVFCRFAALAALILAGGCSDRAEDGQAEVTPPPAQAAASRVGEGTATNPVPQTARPPQTAQPPQRPVPEPEKAAQEKPVPAVAGFEASEGEINLKFTDRPDLVALMDYVKVKPKPGPLTQDWVDWRDTCILRGDFKPRTTYQVVVHAGLPMADGRVTAKEFRRTWTTGDRSPSVAFASAGRYLPAGGRRAVAVKTVNVTNLVYALRSVPARNIVQLLAREEDCYDRYYGRGGDAQDTAELAGDPVSRTIRLAARLNEEQTTALDVRGDGGAVANGVYLLSVHNKQDEDEWKRNWKLVCVTDIGLSVREANGTVYVWATSLTRGVPVAGLRVLVYGANNVVLGEGLTDADGWCCCEMPKGETKPFAVVAAQMDDSDVSFLALRGDLDETATLGARRAFVKENGSEAYVWTERGIYRHNEPIFVHAILRDGKGNAPKPFPVSLALFTPDGKCLQRRTQVTDRFGVVSRADFTVPDDQPSGCWEIRASTPGDDGFLLGSRTVRIEEFVPPQIRVKVTPPTETRATTNLSFTVAGEHLFGSPAKSLPAEGAVLFEDAPFAPRGWEAFRFGNENRRLKPNFTTLDRVFTDEAGTARFTVDFPQRARPRAAVKMVVQGSVFESGGRPASARASTLLHAYPYYIGVALPDTIRESPTPRRCRVVLVNPDGTPHVGARRLVAQFERVDSVYELKKTRSGCWEWRTERIRFPLGEEVVLEVSETGLATLAVPAAAGGDFAVTVRDEETDVSFGASYWVGGADDTTVRASLENPSRVTLALDKKIYYPGERPRLTVKAPFAGTAWLNVLREDMLYSQVLTLTNATSEITLEPVQATWAPGVDVALSVVQASRPGQRGVMNRAFGLVPLRAATRDSALDVQVKARVACAPTGGSTVTVDVSARGTDAVGETAVVTVVDEGINLLTDEEVPNPVDWFGAVRDAEHPLWDIYNRLLPILDGGLKRAGAKTGGGAEGDLFRRVSPVPTRRFKPLSLWKTDVALKDGRATVPFTLPEFVGEVRVTAVAYNRRATGAGAVQVKVVPNLVMQPDAPRFAAPGDSFFATVVLANRSGRDGTVRYDLMAGGSVSLARPVHGELKLAKDASETLSFPVTAGAVPGEGTLVFVSEGFGEKHRNEILLPVRPAAPWTKTATTVHLGPGERKAFPNTAATLPEAARRTFLASANPVAELASALEYLVAYPYGCLEQTVARVFPFVTAGGILNTLPVRETSAAADAKGAVEAGIRRVSSMVRANDFVMWPDGTTPPWNREVSLWAAHFLVEASANGFAVPPDRLDAVKGFLRAWAMASNETVGAYACHTLALARTPDRDRMLHWFDRRVQLAPLDRARLARAFVRTGDRDRARDLLAHVQPDAVKGTAFALLALLDLDPDDARIPAFVTALLDARDAETRHWGTTEANAHALLVLGAFYRHAPPAAGAPELTISVDGHDDALLVKRAKRLTGCGEAVVSNRGTGPAFVYASTLALGDPAALSAETNGLAVARRYLRPDGAEADLAKLARGELLIVELTLTAPERTTYSDLVIEELLPACFEPDATSVTADAYPWAKAGPAWELRRELRDDRVLGFSRRFALDAGASVVFRYAVRVVSAGTFILPGPSVEAMYAPALRARGAAGRITVAP